MVSTVTEKKIQQGNALGNSSDLRSQNRLL